MTVGVDEWEACLLIEALARLVADRDVDEARAERLLAKLNRAHEQLVAPKCANPVHSERCCLPRRP